MKKYYTHLLLVLFIMVNSAVLFAQVTIDAEFRPRTEFMQGYKKPLADTLSPALTTYQRTRLNAEYKSEELITRISLQDARIWGNSNNKTSTSKIEMYEAWFEYIFTHGFSVKMGRQPLAYDDQRLFSASNWSNTGSSHDILVLKYSGSILDIHSGFAYNNSKDTLNIVNYSYTPKQNYKALWYLWLSKQVIKGASVSIMNVYEGFEKTNDYKVLYPRLTYGVYLSYANDSSAWSGSISANLQRGKKPGIKYKGGFADLKAYFFAGKISYKFNPVISATIGVDYYSGSAANLEAGKSKTYNRLYGSNHSLNGFMDYYTNLPAQGLINYYGGAAVKLSSVVSAELTGHLFYFEKDFVFSGVKTAKNLGGEADLTLNYKPSKIVSLQGGCSIYFNSDATKKYFKLNNSDTHQNGWAYVMLTVKPQLFKSDK